MTPEPADPPFKRGPGVLDRRVVNHHEIGVPIVVHVLRRGPRFVVRDAGFEEGELALQPGQAAAGHTRGVVLRASHRSEEEDEGREGEKGDEERSPGEVSQRFTHPGVIAPSTDPRPPGPMPPGPVARRPKSCVAPE